MRESIKCIMHQAEVEYETLPLRCLNLFGRLQQLSSSIQIIKMN